MLKVRGGPFADDSNDPRSSYRGHPSFKELMVQQGTGPITDVSALHGHCWPEEEDVEDFIAAYRDGAATNTPSPLQGLMRTCRQVRWRTGFCL